MTVLVEARRVHSATAYDACPLPDESGVPVTVRTHALGENSRKPNSAL